MEHTSSTIRRCPVLLYSACHRPTVVALWCFADLLAETLKAQAFSVQHVVQGLRHYELLSEKRRVRAVFSAEH